MTRSELIRKSFWTPRATVRDNSCHGFWQDPTFLSPFLAQTYMTLPFPGRAEIRFSGPHPKQPASP